LRIIAAALEPIGYRVDGARDLATARMRLDEGSDGYSCVLIDYQLPDGDGTELLRRLHEGGSPLAAIMITASEERDLVKQTMVEGACNFLQKPAAIKDLREAVDAACASTRERRHVAEMRRQVRGAADAQGRLLDAMVRCGAF